LEKLVEQADVLLAELNLPRDLIINNFEELSSIYGLIGDALGSKGGRNFPGGLPGLLSDFPGQRSSGEDGISGISYCTSKSCLEEVAETLRFHGQGIQGWRNWRN